MLQKDHARQWYGASVEAMGSHWRPHHQPHSVTLLSSSMRPVSMTTLGFDLATEKLHAGRSVPWCGVHYHAMGDRPVLTIKQSRVEELKQLVTESLHLNVIPIRTLR
eukprot:4207406-Amphidinium_carterae.2